METLITNNLTTPTVTVRDRLAIFATAGIAFCGVLVETSMNVTFPTLIKTFGSTMNAVQWVTTAYLLAVAATMLLTAYVEHTLPIRAIIGIAATAFLIGGIMCALAPALWLLLLGRVVQAVGTGLALPLVFALVMQLVPRELQGKYTGTAGMVIAVGSSLGPAYGGLAVQLGHWQLIFWLTLPVSLVCWIVANKAARQVQPIAPRHFAWGQLVIAVAGLFLLTMSVNMLGASNISTIEIGSTFVLALLVLCGFVYLAMRSDQPLVNLHVFRQKGFTPALVIYFTVQFVQIGFSFLLPTIAQLALGQSALTAGMTILAGTFVSAILSPLGGKLMDRRGIRRPLLIGAAWLLLATILLAAFANHLTVASITIFYIFYMIGFSFTFNNALTFALQQLPQHRVADGNALFNTMQQYSGSLSTALLAALLAFGGRLAPTTNAANQTVIGGAIGLWVCVLGAVIIMVAVLAIIHTANQTRERLGQR